ncbi:HEAT repeat domain-containing protein [Ammoniphilus resinae]|uniref:HEAT repeat protein n=1 Tax=Ammoniphilus resinae TaxID=861532 RepID=A0ABS4GL23_9BACL|nr:HEAT repeat domain-containing protein [Ammoniphilus resinae]MBP1930968.1 HEAT repeat protein [Ammoniphilus resinae]
MFTNLNLAIYFLYILALVNVVLIAAIYIIKMRNIKKQKIIDYFQQRFQDYLTYLHVNLEGKERLHVPPFKMNRVEQVALQERLNEMIDSFTGGASQKLLDLCEDLGFVHYHLDRLQSRSYRNKVDAAYHLGCMRVKEAVPALLQFLETHKYNSTLFVIARSISRCARDELDVRAMVSILMMHKKEFSDLLADIIKEATVDHAALFGEYLQANDPALVRLGLAGVKEYHDPKVSSVVYGLLDAQDTEIQRLAVRIYLKSAHFLPRNVVNKLIRHERVEIRLLTIQALTEWKHHTYLNEMKEALMDPDRRVMYASAVGLMELGQEGVVVLCGSALEMKGAGRGEAIQGIIEDEIKNLSTKLHDVEHLARYNAILYTYEKTFDENKRIYRIV